MKIYLAARFGAQQEMLGVRDVLTGLGHEITSRWIDLDPAVVGPSGLTVGQMSADPEGCAPYAAADMADLLAADAVAVFTVYGPSSTGGRHVELGAALASGKRVIVIGPLENIFQTLPCVERFSGWPALARELARGQFKVGDSGTQDGHIVAEQPQCSVTVRTEQTSDLHTRVAVIDD